MIIKVFDKLIFRCIINIIMVLINGLIEIICKFMTIEDVIRFKKINKYMDVYVRKNIKIDKHIESTKFGKVLMNNFDNT